VEALVDVMREALDAPVERLGAMGARGAEQVRERHAVGPNAAALADVFVGAGRRGRAKEGRPVGLNPGHTPVELPR
jgi:hypothetical protein